MHMFGMDMAAQSSRLLAWEKSLLIYMLVKCRDREDSPTEDWGCRGVVI